MLIYWRVYTYKNSCRPLSLSTNGAGFNEWQRQWHQRLAMDTCALRISFIYIHIYIYCRNKWSTTTDHDISTDTTPCRSNVSWANATQSIRWKVCIHAWRLCNNIYIYAYVYVYIYILIYWYELPVMHISIHTNHNYIYIIAAKAAWITPGSRLLEGRDWSQLHQTYPKASCTITAGSTEEWHIIGGLHRPSLVKHLQYHYPLETSWYFNNTHRRDSWRVLFPDLKSTLHRQEL